MFALDGMLRARSEGLQDPLRYALGGLQQWLNTRGVPWADCTTRSETADTSRLLTEETLQDSSTDEPSLVAGLTRIAAGAQPGSSHLASATAVPLGALAALWHDEVEAVFRLGVELARLTHGNREGHLPAGVHAVATSGLLNGNSLAESIDHAVRYWDVASLTSAVRLGRNRPPGFLPGRSQLDAMGAGTSGLDALSIAIRVVGACPDDFATAVRIAADHQGDRASSAMLCGQLLGAAHGPAVIPADWLDELPMRPVLERLSDTAGGRLTETAAPTSTERKATTTRQEDGPGRFLGAVLGSAAGEALGTQVAGQSWDEIRARHGPDGITSYIPAGHPAGRLGSDTQLLLFSLEGFLRAHVARRTAHSEEPFRHVQHAYQRWLHTQHLSWPRAAGEFLQQAPQPDGWLVRQRALFQARNPGRTMMRTLIAFAKGQHALGTPEQPISDSQGSSALLRAIPATLWNDEPGEIFQTAVRSAALTHGHPHAYLSTGALAFLIARLVRGDELHDAAEATRTELAGHTNHHEVSQGISAAMGLADSADTDPNTVETRLGTGWKASEALSIGLYAALTSGNDFDSAMCTAVNHSGNSATTGAVCGSLCGASIGAEAIPAQWVTDLELHDVIETVARDTLREFGERPPETPEWFERYPAT